MGAEIAMVKADKNFGCFCHDLSIKVKNCVNQCFGTAKNDQLPAVKIVFASNKMKQDIELMFCPAREFPLQLEGKVHQNVNEILRLGKLVPVEAAGVENCSLFVWVKTGEIFRMCAESKIHVNDESNTEAYPLPCIETID